MQGQTKSNFALLLWFRSRSAYGFTFYNVKFRAPATVPLPFRLLAHLLCAPATVPLPFRLPVQLLRGVFSVQKYEERMTF